MTTDDSGTARFPFLHRNWIKGVTSWQKRPVMGNAISSPSSKEHHIKTTEEDVPPTKRRRISTPESMVIDHIIASPESGNSRNLRIEVLKMVHKDAQRNPTTEQPTAPRNILTTKGSCRVTISDFSTGTPRVMVCQTQLCDIITYKNPLGPHRIARIHQAQPIFVPKHSLLIHREDDGNFDLSDAYQVQIDLEAVYGGSWPPLDHKDFGMAQSYIDMAPGSARRVTLSSKFQSISGKIEGSLEVSSGHSKASTCIMTDYVLDVDLKWTSGFKAFEALDKDTSPHLSTIEAFQRGESPTKLVQNGSLNGVLSQTDDFAHDIDAEMGGDQTPSRSLRHRETNKVYNLKVLSDQARGLEKKQLTRTDSQMSNDGRVTWVLPTDQPICVDMNRCVVCGACHQSMPLLQIHFATAHPTFECILENTVQGPQFRVTSRSPEATSPSPTKPQHSKQIRKPFVLSTLVENDELWTGSHSEQQDPVLSPIRRNPFHGLRSASPSKGGRGTPRRTIPAVTRSSRPVVPSTAQPLFHPVSKAMLKPGDKLPVTTVDNEWLMQRHHDSIADFSDVTAAEKDFIWEWDKFILQKNITSSVYLPIAWLSFVCERAAWLVSSDQRMIEFGKHMSVLLTREILNDDVITSAFLHINRARDERRIESSRQFIEASGATKSTVSPKANEIHKSGSGCTVCHLPVRGPRQLVCSNKGCTHRLYHVDCVEGESRPKLKTRYWVCSTCGYSAQGS